MTGHLTRRQLEILVTDDPHTHVPPVHRVHVGGCDRCNVRRLAFETSRARYLATHPPDEFARAVLERTRAPVAAAPKLERTWKVVAPVLAAVAIAAGALLWLRPSLESTEGGASLEVFAQHAGVQRSLRDGDVLAAGDQLALAYRLDRSKHLLLLGIDAAGQITRYFPAQGADDQALPATSLAQLPVGVELDARPGDERLYAFFSERRLDQREVRDLLAAELARGRSIASMQAIQLRGLGAQRTVWFRKP